MTWCVVSLVQGHYYVIYLEGNMQTCFLGGGDAVSAETGYKTDYTEDTAVAFLVKTVARPKQGSIGASINLDYSFMPFRSILWSIFGITWTLNSNGYQPSLIPLWLGFWSKVSPRISNNGFLSL